jgi:hypothetical protein
MFSISADLLKDGSCGKAFEKDSDKEVEQKTIAVFPVLLTW